MCGKCIVESGLSDGMRSFDLYWWRPHPSSLARLPARSPARSPARPPSLVSAATRGAVCALFMSRRTVTAVNPSRSITPFGTLQRNAPLSQTIITHFRLKTTQSHPMKSSQKLKKKTLIKVKGLARCNSVFKKFFVLFKIVFFSFIASVEEPPLNPSETSPETT